MYQQKKEYVVLAKEGKKIADAGLLKMSISGKKIRAEYFLNPLPVCYGMKMECVIKLRQKGETATNCTWEEILQKSNSHYSFTRVLSKEIDEIADCRLILPGNQMIVGDAKMSTEEVSLPVKKEETKLQYIRDLDFLKEGTEEMQELYYNSFLLHGFYQYRYFVLGKDFIGVPDHFYEREAIAARMMGFPYFMEAEFMEHCEIGKETRKELPKQGSFGYYMKKINQHREVRQKES